MKACYIDMLISQQDCNRVRALSFVSAILVITLHSYSREVFLYRAGVLWWFQEIVCQGLCRVAVPFFFIASGFFLFRNFPDGKQDVFKWYINTLRKRVRSLLIPYLIWLTIGFGFSWMYSFVSVHATPIVLANFSDVLDFLGVTAQPGAYHLWFVRSLMFIVLISPIIGVLIRRKVESLALLGVASIGLIWTNNELLVGLFYMSIGGMLSIRGRLEGWNQGKKGVVIPCVWIFLCILRSVVVWCGYSFTEAMYMTPINLIGVVSIWIVSGWFIRHDLQNIPQYFGCSFYLYMVHIYILFLCGTVFRKGCGLDGGSLLCFLLTTVTTSFVSVFSWLALRKIVPGLLCVLDGGRSICSSRRGL